MKTQRNLFIIMLALLIPVMANTQTCDFYKVSSGAVFGYQNLDAKGKITGTTRTTFIDVSEVGPAIIYQVKSETADAKNANTGMQEYKMRCEDGKFYVDMQNFIDPKSMESFKDMEVSVDGNDMMYPASLSAGETLPDANITISAATGGVSIMNMVVTITNRQVVGTETVTVPAGTFECYKITYNIETKLMFKINSTVTEYVNMGVGNVKSEAYDKKGKLIGTIVLSELKK